MLDKKWHKKALILGTGGASKAVNYGLHNLGLETVFVSRYERPDTIQYERITPDVIKEYNVTTLFTAYILTALKHFFKYISVSHACRDYIYIIFLCKS